MRRRDLLTTAISSLKRAPIRSLLTTIGVVVGVAAVISMISIGSGAKERVGEILALPDVRLVYLSAHRKDPATGVELRLSPLEGLRFDDYYALLQARFDVSAVSPRIYVSNALAQANGEATTATVEGLDTGGFEAPARPLIEGTLFSALDVRRSASVCIVSRSLAQRLFSDTSPVHQVVRINGVPFKVIGVVDDTQIFSNLAGPPPRDLRVLIPFTSLRSRVDQNSRMSVTLQASRVEDTSSLASGVRDFMLARIGRRDAELRTYTAAASIQLYAEGSQVMARLLLAIGAISLVVGGIGVMNIMLVSVTERTREIGIRMAIGTRNRDILAQFVIEAVVLCVLGAALGIALGLAVTYAIAHLNNWPVRLTVGAIFGAITCSVVTGVLFGYYPARRASLLDPVEALKAE